ncbi:hypothetical protein [Paraferrimonas sp. SM1919]|uniref:hypothetical protein n=1 Tax=Paraferrimonas sp. SM1919 TaxID=2662263 RepID=UPI0013D2D3F7|nr:hypothetical protein [Paraferrimonas sp. SM1919]
MSPVEIFGLSASVVVAISLTMSSIVKLRWLNLVGATMFTVYGFQIDALPVWSLNGFIVLANIYYLRQIYTSTNQFDLVNIDVESETLQHWLGSYKGDIQNYFPTYQKQLSDNTQAMLIMRNNQVCGFVLANTEADNAEIVAEYAFKEYRDFKTGEFLYQQQGLKTKLNVKTLSCHNDIPDFSSYLVKMGFNQQGNVHTL